MDDDDVLGALPALPLHTWRRLLEASTTAEPGVPADDLVPPGSADAPEAPETGDAHPAEWMHEAGAHDAGWHEPDAHAAGEWEDPGHDHGA